MPFINNKQEFQREIVYHLNNSKPFYYMMLKIFSAFTATVFYCCLFSQNQSCPNVDLSQGNFNNWTGYTGTYYAPGTNFGITQGRHTIVSTQATDPNTCNGLSVIPPGHNASVKLGNATSGAQAEELVYTINVTPQSNLFVYKYAVVLQNPGHTAPQQPKFETEILNAAGMPIGGGCGTYTVYGGQPGQNFQSCGMNTWLPWTTVGLDLTPYMGQTIQIKFTTWDCAQGGHYGYAYIAAQCLPLAIDVDFCGGTQPLTLTAPTGFQSYQWQPGNLSGQQVVIANPNINQVYTCTMTTYSNQGTCSVNLNVQASPTLVQSSFVYAASCQNTPIQFQSTSTLSCNSPSVTLQNTWNFGNGISLGGNANAPSALFPNPGNYNVTLISQSSNGCVDTSTQNVMVLPAPHLALQVDRNCIQQSTAFSLTSLSGVNNLSWDFGDGSNSINALNPIHTYVNPGLYTLTLVGQGNNGCYDTLVTPLNIYPLPNINAGADVDVCPGNSVMLQASGGSSYQWDAPYQQNQSFVPTQNNWISVLGTDSLNCVAFDSLHVGIYVIDSVQAQLLQPICSGDSAQLMATVGGNLFWEGNLLNGAFVSPNVGMSTFVVHGNDLNGCASTDTVTLEVYPLPNVNAGNDTVVCVGSQTILQAVGASNYQWSNQLPNGSSMNVLQNQNLLVTGIDFHGCSNVDSLYIGIDSIPTLDFSYGPASGCAPLAVSLNNQSTGNVFTNVLWNFSNGAFLVGDSIQTLFQEVGCFDVSMQVTTPLGCHYSTTQTNAICTFPVPVSNFNLPNQNLSTVYNGGTLENLSSGGSVYAWDFGDGSTVSNEENPYHAFPANEAADYEVMLITTNEYGCSDTSYQLITIHEELTYYVPNAFTPDGNQFNNVWKPVFSDGLDPQNYHVSIFNRWGEIVWESYNENVGWDGTYGTNGLQVQDGVYIYNICFGYKDSSKKENITGHIAMIR